MQKLQKNNLIAQSNKIIEGRYTTTKNELLLLVAMISLIDPKDREFFVFSVTVNELAKILNLDEKSSLREFKRISRKISKKTIEIKTAKGWEIFPWVALCALEGNEVKVIFNKRLKPYLLDLKNGGNFTQYRLEMAAQFKSNYTIRLYQLLREYYSKKIYVFEFSVKDFRQMILGNGSFAYQRFKEFNRFVLKKAQKELNEKIEGYHKSDLNFDLQTRRTGRKISTLIFTIKTQQTKPVKKIQAIETKIQPIVNDVNTPQIILDYEAIGVMRKMVQPYLEQRSEQALCNTLNRFKQDKASGKITKSEQGYLAYLLRVNAGQETTQDKERKQKELNKNQLKEKEVQEKALKATFRKEREQALNGFFTTLQDEELEYIIIDFEASELFEVQIKSWLVLFDLYRRDGIKDSSVKNCFNSFIVDHYLDKTLNNFPQWKEKNVKKQISLAEQTEHQDGKESVN